MEKREHGITVCNWNVNSISKRFSLVKDIILRTKPLLFLLQETRGELDDKYVEELKTLGYRWLNRKSINKGRGGVAVIYRQGLKIRATRELPFLYWENQGRFQYFRLDYMGRDINLVNVYVPTGIDYVNGTSIANMKDKYFRGSYYRSKISFLNTVLGLVEKKINEPFILAGDFNIVTQKQDSWHRYEPSTCRSLVIFSAMEKAIMGRFMGLLTDYSYLKNTGSENYTWYDYKYPFDAARGMKLDYVMVSRHLRCSYFDRLMAYRSLKPTSDHVPLLYTFLIR